MEVSLRLSVPLPQNPIYFDPLRNLNCNFYSKIQIKPFRFTYCLFGSRRHIPVLQGQVCHHIKQKPTESVNVPRKCSSWLLIVGPHHILSAPIKVCVSPTNLVVSVLVCVNKNLRDALKKKKRHIE